MFFLLFCERAVTSVKYAQLYMHVAGRMMGHDSYYVKMIRSTWFDRNATNENEKLMYLLTTWKSEDFFSKDEWYSEIFILFMQFSFIKACDFRLK